jgi:hypothetical protein
MNIALMARFDVYQCAGKGYLLDCQADILSVLSTRPGRSIIALWRQNAVNAAINPVL